MAKLTRKNGEGWFRRGKSRGEGTGNERNRRASKVWYSTHFFNVTVLLRGNVCVCVCVCPRKSRSLRHVNYPVLLDKEAQQSVVREVVQDTTRFDADRSSRRIVDVGLELEDNSIHVRRTLAQVGRRGR